MNKKEACVLLGVTERTLDKYAREGKLTITQVRGKTGLKNDYDAAELEALKIELETPQPPPQRLVAPLAKVGQGEGEQTSAIVSLRGSAPASLHASGAAMMIRAEDFPALAQALSGQAATVVPVADRLTLNLDDAAALSGLSRGTIREAIGSGDLKGRKIGRGWRVGRSDLERWVSGLFTGSGSAVK